MEGDGALVVDSDDRLQADRSLSAGSFGEGHIEATPQPSATGVVPGRDQMYVPGAVGCYETYDLANDTVVCVSNPAGGSEFVHKRQQVKRAKAAMPTISGVVSEDLIDVSDPRRRLGHG